MEKADAMWTVRAGASVAPDALLGDYVVVYPGASIGDRARLDGFTQVWNGVRIGRDVHIESGVKFEAPEEGRCTVLDAGCKLGVGATVRAGVSIGRGAVIEPGSLVSQPIPPYAIAGGVPARIVGYVENRSAEGGAGWRYQADIPNMPSITPMGVGGVTLHRFKLVGDPRGDLSVGEFEKEIPFLPKRYFLVFNVPSEKVRGEHAHYRCHQFLVCVKGSCSVMADDGHTRCEVSLTSPDMGVYLPPLTWGVQYKYSPDAVLLVFASDYYDGEDYIRDYEKFSEVVRAKDAGKS